MFRILSKSRSCGPGLGAAAAGMAMIVGASSPAYADAHRLRGVWGVVTQEVNCATNAPLGPSTRALVTYHADGTVSESRYVPVFAPGQLSTGHGTWRYGRHGTFTGRVVSMVHFDSPATTPPGLPVFQAGWQVATQSITLQDRDNFTATGSSQFFNLEQEVYRVGCATRVGKRFR
jgi:hypothetical protein